MTAANDLAEAIREHDEDLNRTLEGTIGPWKGEPNRFAFEYREMPCLALRNTQGAWCGYAAVGPDHPYYEKRYEDVDADAHGGLTFAEHCVGAVCHTPKEGEPDNVWWLGFDCCHGGDMWPSQQNYGLRSHGTYRDLEYVKENIRQLVDQLIAAGAKKK